MQLVGLSLYLIQFLCFDGSGFYFPCYLVNSPQFKPFFSRDRNFLDKNNFIGFIASGGGEIPLHIKNDNNYNLREYFNNAPDIDENLEINKEIKSILGVFDNQKLNKILFDFIFMAKKGVYGFDKTILNNSSDTNYYKVVQPKKKLKLESLPLDIQDKLNKIRLNISIEETDKINIESILS